MYTIEEEQEPRTRTAEIIDQAPAKRSNLFVFAGVGEYRANTIPIGRLAIDIAQAQNGPDGVPGDIIVRDGSLAMTPKVTKERKVLREVERPTSHIYQAGLTREGDVANSGGPTQRAGRSKFICVVRANGNVIARTGTCGSFRKARPDDIDPHDTIAQRSTVSALGR